MGFYSDYLQAAESEISERSARLVVVRRFMLSYLGLPRARSKVTKHEYSVFLVCVHCGAVHLCHFAWNDLDHARISSSVGVGDHDVAHVVQACSCTSLSYPMLHGWSSAMTKAVCKVVLHHVLEQSAVPRKEVAWTMLS